MASVALALAGGAAGAVVALGVRRYISGRTDATRNVATCGLDGSLGRGMRLELEAGDTSSMDNNEWTVSSPVSRSDAAADAAAHLLAYLARLERDGAYSVRVPRAPSSSAVRRSLIEPTHWGVTGAAEG